MKPKQRFIRTSWVLALVILVGTAASGAGDGSALTTHILVLCSFESDLPMYQAELASFLRVLEEEMPGQVVCHFEYLDAGRFPDDDHLDAAMASYRLKYRSHYINLIALVDEVALSLVVNRYPDFFPGVPRMFFPISRAFLQSMPEPPAMPGITTDIDLEGSLELLHELHPETRHLVIVSGISELVQYFVTETRRLAGRYEQLTVELLTAAPLEQILDRVAGLPEHSVVLYLWMFQDSTGRTFVPARVATMLSNSSAVPVYGAFDTLPCARIIKNRISVFCLLGSIRLKLSGLILFLLILFLSIFLILCKRCLR
jgi:hypothetical protein